MSSFRDKILISAESAALFALINLPFTYRLTDRILPGQLYNGNTNCPTNLGLFIHTLIFFLITFLTMGNPTEDTSLKIKFSLYGTLIFFLVSSPMMYSIVGSILGGNFADTNGCPTLAGVLLHAFVYFLILFGVMYLPERNQSF